MRNSRLIAWGSQIEYRLKLGTGFTDTELSNDDIRKITDTLLENRRTTIGHLPTKEGRTYTHFVCVFPFADKPATRSRHYAIGGLYVFSFFSIPHIISWEVSYGNDVKL